MRLRRAVLSRFLRSVAILVFLVVLNASESTSNVSSDANPCNPSPCQNGATCTAFRQEYHCKCTVEFEGNTCLTRRLCPPGKKTDDPQGRCCVFPFVYDGSTYYSCADGWCSLDAIYIGRGANCQRPCQKTDDPQGRCCVFPFVYNGVSYVSCTMVDHHRLWCSFDAFYSGKWANCVNPCTNNPCQNGGKCTVIGDNRYSCECNAGYYGDSCQKASLCNSSPCKNGATCTVTGEDSYSCNCTEEFEGETCETMNPCTSNPCQNGGKCTVTGEDSYSCQCTADYYGDSCEKASVCSQVFCKKGKMCVRRKVGQVVTAECVCPTSCTNESRPVCSVYHVEFLNLCELHRFACANEINIQVKHQGNCTEQEAKSICSKTEIINFQDWYLQSNFEIRTYTANGGLSLVQRLKYAKREFDQYWDTDGNGLLEEHEILKRQQKLILNTKPCLTGFIKSCNNDGSPGISKQEWFSCFKAEAGQWRWSPWTDCSVTCGDGRQRRTGTCISPSSGEKLERSLCDGNRHETRNCSSGTCPDWMSSVDSDGKWSRWSPWTDCSRSCGKGRQNRTRTCRSQATGKSIKNGWCAGKPQQEKTCADWKCPDGRKESCPANKEGTLKGRILSLRDSPLAGANISLAESPYKILNRSQDNGYFVVDTFCMEKEKDILVTRHGHVAQRVKITNLKSAIKVKMEKAVHPRVTSHPEDRRRFVGQDVAFCCQVEGNPPPVIEWFRNGNILDKDEFNNNETLVLRKVGKNMAGDFRCRAVNDFGAEFSESAVLTVLDLVIDTCNSTPSDNFVTLPDGCVEDGTGKNKINIGKCDDQPCLRADSPFPELCDEAERCCQPGTVNDTTVRCGRGEFKMKRVVSCRCDVCKERSTIVKGVVVGGPDERPVEYCDILVNDTVFAFSDFDGTFEIPVRKSAKRLVATFRDYMEEYAELTVVLPFRKGTTTFHKVHLRPEVAPVEFDAEEGKTVPIASDKVAEVTIPANSLIDKDGNPKKGKAKVKIQFNDPRNERDVLESPGDFTTVDEDGEEQLLRTYGIFKVKVQDENGQNLGLTKNLQLNIDLEQLTGETFDDSAPVIHLWWLDAKTGRWVDIGELKQDKELTKRRKRQLTSRAFSGEITPENLQDAINLDKTLDMCLTKLRAVGQGGAGIQSAKVTSIFANPRGLSIQGYVRRTTGSDGFLCIQTQCNSDGYLEVEKDGLPLLPNQAEVNVLPLAVGASIVDTRRIKFNPGAWVINGPVYQRSQSGSCWGRSVGQSFFIFHSQDNRPGVFNQAYVPLVNMARYRASSRIRRCFVKIVTSGTTSTLVKAESFTPDGQTKLGETIKLTTQVNNGNIYAACLEYNCPRLTETLIRFTVLTGECQRSKLKQRLDTGRNSGPALNVENVLIPRLNVLSGTEFGIFEWSRFAGQSIRDFDTTCVNSAIDESDPSGDVTGFAVKFDCAN